MHTEEIRLIEALAYNAWPASVVQIVDGWRVRFHHGVTARANSVWPNECHGEMDLQTRMRLVDDFYARRGRRPIFQMCPAALPSELEAELARRGYVGVRHASTQTASTDAVLDYAGRAARGKAIDVTLGDLDDAWFDAYAEGDGMKDHERKMRRGIVERIGPRACFALARIDGQPAGVGLGVTERGWTGIFCMETLPRYRRLGAATAVLRALAEWGKGYAATRMYLQVMLNNPVALAAYDKAGFAPQYAYFHYEAPAV